MAYARWGDSVFYVYADTGGGLTIHGSLDQSLNLDNDVCLDYLISPDGHWVNEAVSKEHTEEEVKELRGYIREYLEEELESAVAYANIINEKHALHNKRIDQQRKKEERWREERGGSPEFNLHEWTQADDYYVMRKSMGLDPTVTVEEVRKRLMNG